MAPRTSPISRLMHPFTPRWGLRLGVAALLLAPVPLAAQARDTARAAAPLPDSARLDTVPLPPAGGAFPAAPFLHRIGGLADDRARVRQILGQAPTAGYLLRSASAMNAGGGRRGFTPFLPQLRTVVNTGLPYSFNDGPLWAGRGINVEATGGFRAVWGRLSVVVAPVLTLSQNADYETQRYPGTDRNPFSSPWHTEPESLDLPVRFGVGSRAGIDPGESSVTLRTGPVALGAATENLWWGPGIRNAIVMSNHAAGIPHVFVRTASPLRTPLGRFEGRWMTGWLSESRYFDTLAVNDRRSISALALAWTPSEASGLTLGASRAVYAPLRSRRHLAGRLLDVFTSVGRPDQRPISDRERPLDPDQVFSLFGRWVLPGSGFETWAEWARYEEPRNLRDLLQAPHHSQGYTVGLQWARPLSEEGVFRLQSEFTYLEPSATLNDRRVISWYTSRPVPQGYTQLGQVIGAAIGPGASSQWVAGDVMRPRWQMGGYLGRIRWNNASFYTAGNPPPTYWRHDVSVLGGVRGARKMRRFDLAADLSASWRMNYQFQNPSPGYGSRGASDKMNFNLTLTVSPPAPWQ